MASLKDIKNGLFPKKEEPPVDPFSDVMFRRKAQAIEQANMERTKDIKDRNEAIRNEHTNSPKVREARKKVEDNISKMINGRSEAFVEWATGMNSIVSYLRDFNEYLFLSMGNGPIPHASWDKSNSDNLNIGDGKAQPDISYSVTMDDTGRIKSAVTADNEIIRPEDKEFFDVALSAWADSNDCTLIAVDKTNPDAGFTLKNNKTGQLVDKAAFDNLKKDPTNGLHSYLTDRFAMTLEEKDTPSIAAP